MHAKIMKNAAGRNGARRRGIHPGVGALVLLGTGAAAALAWRCGPCTYRPKARLKPTGWPCNGPAD